MKTTDEIRNEVDDLTRPFEGYETGQCISLVHEACDLCDQQTEEIAILEKILTANSIAVCGHCGGKGCETCEQRGCFYGPSTDGESR